MLFLLNFCWGFVKDVLEEQIGDSPIPLYSAWFCFFVFLIELTEKFESFGKKNKYICSSEGFNKEDNTF